jgi:hypothetical protein
MRTVLSLLILAAGLASAQTKTITDTHCVITIPADWVESTGGTGAHSADRGFVVTIRGFVNAEIDSVVDGMKKMKAKVVDDNTSRVLLQMPVTGTAKTQWIQITKTSPLACRASVTYSEESQAGAARKIAETVKPK